MANDFKNTSLVTKYAVKAFLNALVLGSKVDRQLDEKNVYSKVGATVNVRRPVMFAATASATISKSDIEEGIVPVILNNRQHVAFAVSTQDMTLKIEDANERYIKPAMAELAQQVESAIAAMYVYIPNHVGTPGTSPGSFLSVANAKAKLDNMGVPMGERCAFFDPDATVTLSDGLKAVYPQEVAKKAIEEAVIGRYAGFDMFTNQSLKSHTVGVATGTPLVNGASQNTTYLLSKDTQTQSLITDGWTNDTAGILTAGDVITIAGVNSVNRRTREDTGSLAQFTVTAAAASGATTGPATLTISPAIITSGAYKTCTAAPADDAVITVKTGTGGTAYRQNLAFHKQCITLAVAQLDTYAPGADSARESFEGISITTKKQYDIDSDTTAMRFDILFGVKTQIPEFGCRITS